jgi:hypothetical protein
MAGSPPFVGAGSDHLHIQYVPSSSNARHKHQGRKRQFPHVEGNFATHVYMSGMLHHTKLVSSKSAFVLRD